MKKISFVCILLLLCCLKSTSQIQLVNTVAGGVQFSSCTTTDGKQLIVGVNDYHMDNKVTIYNADFSINREVTLNIPNLLYITSVRLNGDGDLYYGTNHLFNEDNILEFAVSLKDSVTGKFGFAIVNEDNVILLSKYCDNTTDYASLTLHFTKTRSYLAVEYGSSKTEIYSLPGTERFDSSPETTTPNSVKEISASVAESPFPNPAKTTVKLTYTLREGKKGTIQVFDVNGRLLNSFVVNGAFPYVDLDIPKYSAGTYVYKVQEGSSVLSSGKFIVEK